MLLCQQFYDELYYETLFFLNSNNTFFIYHILKLKQHLWRVKMKSFKYKLKTKFGGFKNNHNSIYL